MSLEDFSDFSVSLQVRRGSSISWNSFKHVSICVQTSFNKLNVCTIPSNRVHNLSEFVSTCLNMFSIDSLLRARLWNHIESLKPNPPPYPASGSLGSAAHDVAAADPLVAKMGGKWTMEQEGGRPPGSFEVSCDGKAILTPPKAPPEKLVRGLEHFVFFSG